MEEKQRPVERLDKGIPTAPWLRFPAPDPSLLLVVLLLIYAQHKPLQTYARSVQGGANPSKPIQSMQ